MTFDKLEFNDSTLNKFSSDIIKKAEKLHTEFEDPRMLHSIMENGASLGKEFYDQTISSFNEIKDKIGVRDDRVKMLSEIIAVTAITLARFTCQHANVFAMSSDFKSQPEPVIGFTRISVEEAITLIEKVRPLEMSQRARDLLNETSNMSTVALKRLSKTGCFVATCVYQDFNAPEILLLRKYRDQVLKRSIIGKLSIQLYYFASPILVNFFGHRPVFRKTSFYIINKIVKTLNK